MWTALSSSPANATKVPTTNAMLESPSNGGVTALRSGEVAQPGRLRHPSGHDPGRPPESHQDHSTHVEPVAGEVRPPERRGERGGTEGQQRGVEGDAVHEDRDGPQSEGG